MAYIDREKLIRDLIDNKQFYPALVKRAIENAPTEDVVPKSEVEEIVKFKDMAYAELKSLFVEAKQEVALQIINEFKDIVIEYVQEKDLLLVAFKNAVAHAENELKKKHIGE